MKLGIWTIILALVLWTSSAEICVQDAMATSIGTVDLGGTNTSTSTFTSVMPTNTNTATVTQLQHQNDANNLNQQGDSSSTGLGLAAIAAGMAMVAAGMALMANPMTAAAGAALVAAGMMLIAAGMAALAAASNMRKNGQQAGGYANNLGPSDTAKLIGPGDLKNSGEGNSIKIDPALARNGKVGEILTDFEKKTGMSRDDLVDGLNNGKTPLEMLAPKVGKSESDLQSYMDKAIANNEPLNAQDVLGKLGLTEQDLGAGAYTAGGGDRKVNSTTPPTDFDSLFGKNNLDAGSTGGGVALGGSVSPEVQAALDRNGITSRSIFDMVRTQYQKKTPLMFGVKREQIQGVRPIYDLKGTAALEF